MCNHKWKTIVSYNHPYMISKAVVVKVCELCNEKIIVNSFRPLGVVTFGMGFIRNSKQKVKTRSHI